ncbi:MAG: asparaginase [Pelosinus sp.]|nr:asparaginase [Pelosinus sp.]
MKHIVILATGGTIAGKASSKAHTAAYQSAVVSINELLQEIGSLADTLQITSEQIAQIDSADMTFELWLAMAHRINELLRQPEVDGIVITHGTDTLEETAYFLNLVVKSSKPVVLVGAMRPTTAISCDGPMNLYNGVILAAHPAAAGKGVLVTLNDTINASRDVTKTNTALPDTFKAPELGYLGYIIDGQPHFYRAPIRKHTYMTEFSLENITEFPKVDILYGYVHDTGMLAYVAEQAGVRGLIYAGLGSGNMPKAVKTTLRALQKQGIIIVRSTRVPNGIVLRNGAINDDDYHFIAGDTLSPQKARILLMLALTKTTDLTAIQDMFWQY